MIQVLRIWLQGVTPAPLAGLSLCLQVRLLNLRGRLRVVKALATFPAIMPRVVQGCAQIGCPHISLSISIKQHFLHQLQPYAVMTGIVLP